MNCKQLVVLATTWVKSWYAILPTAGSRRPWVKVKRVASLLKVYSTWAYYLHMILLLECLRILVKQYIKVIQPLYYTHNTL